MTLRTLARVVNFGVVLPFGALVLLAIAGKISVHGDDWALLAWACLLLLAVASVTTVIVGLLFRPRTEESERARLMRLLLVGGAPTMFYVVSLVYYLARWIICWPLC